DLPSILVYTLLLSGWTVSCPRSPNEAWSCFQAATTRSSAVNSVVTSPAASATAAIKTLSLRLGVPFIRAPCRRGRTRPTSPTSAALLESGSVLMPLCVQPRSPYSLPFPWCTPPACAPESPSQPISQHDTAANLPADRGED